MAVADTGDAGHGRSPGCGLTWWSVQVRAARRWPSRSRARAACPAARPRRRRTGGGRRRAVLGAEPAGGGERAVGVRGPVAGGEPQLDGSRPDRRRSRGACPGRRRRGCPRPRARGGRPSRRSRPDRPARVAAVIRRAIARAVPDGPVDLAAPVPLDDRRLEPAGRGIPARPRASASRRNSAAPSERFGATTAAARCSSSRARTRATSPSQRARREDEPAGCRPAARGRGCRRRRRRATPRRRRRRAARVAPTVDAGARRRSGAASRRPWPRAIDGRAEASRSIDEEVHDLGHPFADRAAVPEVRESQRPRHRRGVRGPFGRLRSRRLRSFVARAPSEPQGPSLPAGPPRLLLGVEGGEDEVRHCSRSMPGAGSMQEIIGWDCIVSRIFTRSCSTVADTDWGPMHVAATSDGHRRRSTSLATAGGIRAPTSSGAGSRAVPLRAASTGPARDLADRGARDVRGGPARRESAPRPRLDPARPRRPLGLGPAGPGRRADDPPWRRRRATARSPGGSGGRVRRGPWAARWAGTRSGCSSRATG